MTEHPQSDKNASAFDKTAADRMAAIVDEMIYAGHLDPRSQLADARLDYGQPFTEKAERILKSSRSAEQRTDPDEYRYGSGTTEDVPVSEIKGRKSARSHELPSEPVAWMKDVTHIVNAATYNAMHESVKGQYRPLYTRSATVSSEDAACEIVVNLLRNEIVRLEYPKSMIPQEAEKIGRRQTAFQEAIRFLAPPERTAKPCPYCTSDNEAIRSTYYDQTCEGCVRRMG